MERNGMEGLPHKGTNGNVLAGGPRMEMLMGILEFSRRLGMDSEHGIICSLAETATMGCL